MKSGFLRSGKMREMYRLWNIDDKEQQKKKKKKTKTQANRQKHASDSLYRHAGAIKKEVKKMFCPKDKEKNG